MNLKLAGKRVVSFLFVVAFVFSSVAYSRDAETPADQLSERVELEDGNLVVRVGYGLFIHDFLTGKTSISALNRTFDTVEGSDVVSYRKPSIGIKGSMFLKEGYFDFTKSKGVGELAEALSGRWDPYTKAGCNAQYRRAELDTSEAINSCLNSGLMQCEAAIEQAAQSWPSFDMCMSVQE
ncbi:MAG: hypothetical protein IPK97_18255 [Ahniella sp.]|nr:hypothetical protein [Ahniella sp.]